MNELIPASNTITSLEVAEMVGKRHDHLMRDIKKYIEEMNAPNVGEVDFFQESTYTDGKGEDTLWKTLFLRKRSATKER